MADVVPAVAASIGILFGVIAHNTITEPVILCIFAVVLVGLLAHNLRALYGITDSLHRLTENRHATDALALTTLLTVALGLRWVFFHHVAVWGDFGFYVYDAKLILKGETPFIDFLGRSPLFLFSYAGVASLTGEFIRTLRWFAIAWYLLAAIPTYLIGLQVRGRRTAILGTALMLLTPFSIAYGVRASTQSMALFFSLWGIYAVLRSRSVPAVGLAGCLVALGFLARQSMIAIAGGLGLWMLWLAYREQWPLRRFTGLVTALSVAFVGTLFVGYTLVVGNVSQGLALFDQQVLGLFFTSGRGGLPLIGVEFPQLVSQSPGIPVLNAVCPQCGPRTARVFSSTIFAAAPVVGLLFVMLRDWLSRVFTRTQGEYVGGIIISLGAYGSLKAFRAGIVHRPIAVLGLLALGLLIWTSPRVESERLYCPESLLLVLLLSALSAGYLVRDRMIANYYFLDFWPLLCVLAGFVAVIAIKRMSRPRRVAMVGLMCLLVLTSGVAAHPLSGPLLDDNDAEQNHWFRVETVERYGDDLDARTEAGDRVFLGHPTYISASNAEMPMDDPRIHYRYSAWATADGLQWPAAEMFRHVEPRLANGTYGYVILDSMTARILQYDRILTEQFLDGYCRVESADELYADTGAQLYEYHPDCPADRQPTSAMIETIALGEYYGMDQYERQS